MSPSVSTQRFIRTAIPQVYGTADLVFIGRCAWNPDGGLLCHAGLHAIVADLKSGMADRGPAADHLQLRAYAAGLLYENPDILTVELWLIELDKQFISKSEVFEREPFLAKVHAEITQIIEKVKSATEKDYVQNSSCRYCVRAVTCPAIESALRETVGPITASLSDAQQFVDMMAPEKVAWFLDKWKAKAEVFASLVRTVEGRAFAILKAGGDVPGWAIEEGRKMRSWENPQVAEETLRAVYGDRVLTTELKSPAQVEKEFKEAKSLVKRLVQTKPSEKLIKVEGETNV